MILYNIFPFRLCLLIQNPFSEKPLTGMVSGTSHCTSLTTRLLEVDRSKNNQQTCLSRGWAKRAKITHVPRTPSFWGQNTREDEAQTVHGLCRTQLKKLSHYPQKVTRCSLPKLDFHQNSLKSFQVMPSPPFLLPQGT